MDIHSLSCIWRNDQFLMQEKRVRFSIDVARPSAGHVKVRSESYPGPVVTGTERVGNKTACNGPGNFRFGRTNHLLL